MSQLAPHWQRFLAAKRRSEAEYIPELLQQLHLSEADRTEISQQALVIIGAARSNATPLLDSFLSEYKISEGEGVALMCLAEALLRIPDARTRDQLIQDKLGFAQWAEHKGQSKKFWVNASTYGLALTGRVLNLKQRNSVGKSLHRLSQPVIRRAVAQAVAMLGEQFVLGESLARARAKAVKLHYGPWLFSYDMLGEGARTREDAERYFQDYKSSIEALAGQTQPNLLLRAGVSVKLSALYPRFEFSHAQSALTILQEKLLTLALAAAAAGIPLTIDAEESHRQMMTLKLVQTLIAAPQLAGWNGLGVAMQAYSKSALAAVHWLIALVQSTDKTLTVRLVKGAYWDSEIKQAQEQGLEDFPVFSRRCNTDLSYLACAQRLLAARPAIYPAFASHNANTLAAVRHMAGNSEGYEFQRLHGMGEAVYRQARQHWRVMAPARIYAPVGSHKELLAYLVRRLIENGANSSFVNQLADAEVSTQQLAHDAVAQAANSSDHRHPGVVWPRQLFGQRPNAMGLDLNDVLVWRQIKAALAEHSQSKVKITPLVAGWQPSADASKNTLVNPANNGDVLGTAVWADDAAVQQAFTMAQQHWPQWRDTDVAQRAQCLRAAADCLEQDMYPWLALLVREAGKTWGDAVAEIREAVDFCRYYAQQAQQQFAQPIPLPEGGAGVAGESNQLSYHGRGIFVCISPWNFPLAIFIGQVTAALVTGNAVVAKPAQQTSIIAQQAVALLHRCGIPEGVLALLPGGRELGADMIKQPLVAGVAFTGSVAAAQAVNRALAAKDGPIVPLIAETGGQNVMIADSSALPEQLCDDVMRSAFASAGQRCSALRVLYLQKEIYPKVVAMLKGAMAQWVVANPENLYSDAGPIIDAEAREKLRAYIAQQKATAKGYFCAAAEVARGGYYLAPCLLEIDDIQQIPGEQFGPILHVIEYQEKNLPQVLEQAQSTDFGLTFGIHSRIETKARAIAQNIAVGNVYVNRNMIGAVVGLQPFGGIGLSGTGPKAGGPHYLTRFCNEKSISVNTVAVGGNSQLLNLTD
ncbi:bifunctional proline dehydrogenase/L-glutamate gamma-semialdehyde dehydrogenase PutA [Halioxenophilus aromaticivorans]|uniref:Bifunctional protein PutA n=1 Tax=Halioxenophilus aromaticivorans TaxID=1306992 RepID=A0AAV3U978_9ALTE